MEQENQPKDTSCGTVLCKCKKSMQGMLQQQQSEKCMFCVSKMLQQQQSEKCMFCVSKT